MLPEHPHTFWNGEAAQRWVRQQPHLDHLLGSWLDAGLLAAAPRAGERVLDVGCGAGTSTLALAEAVGPDGEIVGVDVSGPLLAHARARAGENSPITWILGDAGSAEIPGPFDLLFSRFGVMFFPDPLAAMRHLVAHLRPGGRVCFVVWRSMDQNPWFSIALSIADALVGPLPAADPTAPGPASWADADRLSRLLTDAGLAELRFTPVDLPAPTPATLDQAVHEALTLGPIERYMLSASPQIRAAAAERLRQALDDGQGRPRVLTGAVWIVTGHRPDSP